MKLSFFSVLAFAVLILSSCGRESSDINLIETIQNATNKQIIDASELPDETQSVLAEDFSESYVETAQLAPELGYEVGMRRGRGSQIGEHAYVYFGIDGRELTDRKGKDKGHRHGCNRNECYELVYPVTYVMPDGTAISGDDHETLRADIKEWYKENRGEREKPSLEFPVDIIYEDGTVVTLENEQDMRSAYEYCKGEEWEKKCFEKVFPLTVTMPDGTEITMTEEDDWQTIKDWYEANPDTRERPVLQYPVDIMYEDGTVVTIESEEDMRSAIEDCKEG